MPEELHTTLAKNIRRYRQASDMTQDELSDRAGVAYSTIAKLEQGAIKNPTLATVTAIARSLDINLDDLTEATIHDVDKDKSETPIKFVYFDLNGVLVRFYHRAFTDISREINISIDKVENLFWHYNSAGNRGDISMKEFDTYFGEALGIKNFKWADYYLKAVEPLKSVHDYLAKIQDKVNIGILTNTFPGLLKKMVSSGLIPDIKYKAIVDSSEVGAVKPEPRIYEIAEQKAKAKGAQILFIDDSRQNLMAAEHRGWRVMWFDDYHPKESLARIQETLKLER